MHTRLIKIHFFYFGQEDGAHTRRRRDTHKHAARPIQYPPTHTRDANVDMADQNLVYYALLFGAVLAYPIFRLVAKQLGQFSGTPGQGKSIVGDGYGGENAVYTRADVAKHNTQDDLWVGIAAAR